MISDDYFAEVLEQKYGLKGLQVKMCILLSKGMTSNEIQSELLKSRAHLLGILRVTRIKLGVKDRVQLVAKLLNIKYELSLGELSGRTLKSLPSKDEVADRDGIPSLIGGNNGAYLQH